MTCRLWTRREYLVGCSKRRDFSPAQPRRAKTRLSVGKAAQAKRRGGTYRTSCGPFALRTDLGDRKSPASNSNLREACSVRSASERSENAAGSRSFLKCDNSAVACNVDHAAKYNPASRHSRIVPTRTSCRWSLFQIVDGSSRVRGIACRCPSRSPHAV